MVQESLVFLDLSLNMLVVLLKLLRSERTILLVIRSFLLVVLLLRLGLHLLLYAVHHKLVLLIHVVVFSLNQFQLHSLEYLVRHFYHLCVSYIFSYFLENAHVPLSLLLYWQYLREALFG